MHNSPISHARDSGTGREHSALRTLNAFAVDLITIPSTEDLFWYVAQNVVGRLNFVDCVIYQANDAQTDIRQVAAWGEKNPFGRMILDPLVIPFGRGITGQVALTREPIIVEDLLRDQNYIPDTQPARSEICVPLLFRGRVIGVIDSEHPEPNAFGEAELEILTTVAAMTGAKLELLAEAERSHQRYRELVASHQQLTHEISARKALESKLYEARKHEAVGRLTGRLAHEFNNLLTVILGNIELLEAGGLPPGSEQFVKDAKISAGKGVHLIQDMLAFAQRTRLEPTPLNLNAVLSRLYAPATEGGDIVLTLATDLWKVSADVKGIETILRHLVENARDAMDGGGKVVITSENTVRTALNSAELETGLLPGRYVKLSVSDTGVGIPKDRLSQIFDPFYSSKSFGVARGMGLSSVRGIALQSGGAVTVTSEVGHGSTFEVILPALAD